MILDVGNTRLPSETRKPLFRTEWQVALPSADGAPFASLGGGRVGWPAPMNCELTAYCPFSKFIWIKRFWKTMLKHKFEAVYWVGYLLFTENCDSQSRLIMSLTYFLAFCYVPLAFARSSWVFGLEAIYTSTSANGLLGLSNSSGGTSAGVV